MSANKLFGKIYVTLNGCARDELAVAYAEELARATSAELILGSAHRKASRAVLHDIERSRADLVVTTSSRRSPLGSRLGASAAERLVRFCPVPVLLVTPAQAGVAPSSLVQDPLIVVPLDGSDYAERSLAFVEHYARAFRGRCVLVQAREPRAAMCAADELASCAWLAPIDPDDEDEYLSGVARRLDTSGPVVHNVCWGDPVSAVADAAAEYSASLIAISTRSRAGAARLLFGSVASGVARRAKAPLLLFGPACTRFSPARPLSQSSVALPAPRPRASAPPALPAPRQSPVELLHEALQLHRHKQRDCLAACGRLGSSLRDPVAKFLLELVVAGQVRHHDTLDRIEATLRDSIQWTRSRNAIPAGSVPETRRTAVILRDCLRREREIERGARDLARAYGDLRDGLDRLLLETLRRDSATRQLVLSYTLKRIESNQANDPLPSSDQHPLQTFDALLNVA